MNLAVLHSQPLTVIDAGGKDGFDLLPQLHGAMHVFAFEPDPDSLNALRALYAKRSPFHTVNVFSTALSDTNGEAAFHRAQHPSMSSLLPPDRPRFDESFGAIRSAEQWAESMRTVERITVQTETLAAFAAAQGLSSIDLLKLDTQGAELKILKGAEALLRAGKVAMIYTEVLLLPVYEGQPVFTDVDRYLRELGYRFIDLRIYPEVIARKNAVGVDGKLYEEPKYCSGGDAVYVPDFSKNKHGVDPLRSAVLLAGFGYFSDSRYVLREFCRMKDAEIDALFAAVAPKRKRMKRFLLRWLPPAVVRGWGRMINR